MRGHGIYILRTKINKFTFYGAAVTVCSETNMEQMNTVWTECVILKFQTCWYMKPVDFKRLNEFLNL